MPIFMVKQPALHRCKSEFRSFLLCPVMKVQDCDCSSAFLTLLIVADDLPPIISLHTERPLQSGLASGTSRIVLLASKHCVAGIDIIRMQPGSHLHRNQLPRLQWKEDKQVSSQADLYLLAVAHESGSLWQNASQCPHALCSAACNCSPIVWVTHIVDPFLSLFVATQIGTSCLAHFKSHSMHLMHACNSVAPGSEPLSALLGVQAF